MTVDIHPGTPNADERVFTEASARQILDEIKPYFETNPLIVAISSWWGAGQRWARNTASLTSDQRQITVTIIDAKTGARCDSNQWDSESLKGMAETVRYYSKKWTDNRPNDRIVDPVKWSSAGQPVWSDATYNVAFDEIAKTVSTLTQRVSAENLLSAGFIEATGSSALRYTRDAHHQEATAWGSVTQARCSATVRHPLGNGSGWAGRTAFDWARINIGDLTTLAFEKCKMSLNPVRIEPGRYQTILEPDAAGTFVGLFVGALGRATPEAGHPVATFLTADPSYGRFRSKLGLKLVDERVNIYHDPADPIMGTHPDQGVQKINLIERGILTHLWEKMGDRINDVSDLDVSISRSSFAMSGGQTSMDEMIRTTERGLLISRLAVPEMAHGPSLLYTGVTRDGMWLIERGKITKALRNMRWTESPLFALNNLEQLGAQELLFRPIESRNPLIPDIWDNPSFQNSLKNVLVPSMKINDFSFTSTIDAV